MDQKAGFEECKRIAQIAQTYASCCSDTFNDMRMLVTERLYGVGGECIYRGSYCPSKIIDIVTNTKRGRVIRKQPKAPTFVYGFDMFGHLLTVETSFSREFIIHKQGEELGIAFNGRFDYIETISESLYDEIGRIKSYSLYVYNGPQHSVIDFSREVYTYDDQLMVDYYHFLNSKSKPILDHTRYIFQTPDGVLRSYTFEKYKEGNRVPSVWDGHTFKVKSERKI